MDQQAPNGADFMVQPGGGQADAVQNGIAIAANSGGSGTPVNGTGGGSTPGSTGIYKSSIRRFITFFILIMICMTHFNINSLFHIF